MSSAEFKNCPYCDERIRAVARKCRHCGSDLTADHESTPTRNNAGIWIGLILFGAFAAVSSIGVVLYGVLHGGSDGKPTINRHRITSTKDIEQKVILIISEQFQVPKESIRLETSFVGDLKADSLDLIEIVMELEEEFGIHISDEDANRLQTVESAVNYIREKQ